MALLRNGCRILSQATEIFARPLSAALPSLPHRDSAPSSAITLPSGSHSFHTCSVLNKKIKNPIPKDPQNWPLYNDIVYPPREEGLPVRPAEVFHYRAHIKYSTKKLWYIAMMIRGMSVDEAIKSLSFMKRKGSLIVKETLEEAQELAVKEHNVEYKSNLWIVNSYATKARIVKGLRKHARGRYGIIHYRYSHYFVCLREGRPPKVYIEPDQKTGNEKIKEYLESLRERDIKFAL